MTKGYYALRKEKLSIHAILFHDAKGSEQLSLSENATVNIYFEDAAAVGEVVTPGAAWELTRLISQSSSSISCACKRQYSSCKSSFLLDFDDSFRPSSLDIYLNMRR